MPTLTIRKVPEAAHRVRKQRADTHGRSNEAEIRKIIEAAVRQKKRFKIGTELAALGKRFRGPDLSINSNQRTTNPAVFG